MSSDNVVKLFNSNNPDSVLECAKGHFKDVLVLGWDEDENLVVTGSSAFISIKEACYLIKTFEHTLMNGDYTDE